MWPARDDTLLHRYTRPYSLGLRSTKNSRVADPKAAKLDSIVTPSTRLGLWGLSGVWIPIRTRAGPVLRLRLAWRAPATSQHSGQVLIVAASPTSRLAHQGLPRVPDRYHALGGQVLETVSPWITITRLRRPLATRMNARRFRPGDNPSRTYMDRGDRGTQTTATRVPIPW